MFCRTIVPRTILFLCSDNVYASQMAEGIAKHLAPPKARILSAGMVPGAVNPAVAQIMKEIGVDISGQRPKPLTDVPIDEVDLAVVIGMSPETCTTLPPGLRIERWPIPDLRRMTGEESALRYLRDAIDNYVAALFLDYWRNVA
jgi:protein-tyrosine-phosphatase